MVKKRRDDVSHVTITSIGNDYFSQGFKRIENTNPALLALNMANIASQAFVFEKDEKKQDHARRDFLLAVGAYLVKYSCLTDEALKMSVGDLVGKAETLVASWEQDDAKRKELESKIQKAKESPKPGDEKAKEAQKPGDEKA